MRFSSRNKRNCALQPWLRTDRVTESCHHLVKSSPKRLQRKAETLETEGVGGWGGIGRERGGKEGDGRGRRGGEFKVCYQAHIFALKKISILANFGKNGYTKKWENVIFDDKNMFSIPK